MPQTTDRTTENTNVDEKKIITRAIISTTKTSGVYWQEYDGQEYITYQKAGTNNYCLDGYFARQLTGSTQIILTPLNNIALDPSTGKVVVEGLATENSFVNPEGNFINIAYRYLTTNVSVEDIKAYRITYATAVSQSFIW